jgi:hypothetical protein
MFLCPVLKIVGRMLLMTKDHHESHSMLKDMGKKIAAKATKDGTGPGTGTATATQE